MSLSAVSGRCIAVPATSRRPSRPRASTLTVRAGAGKDLLKGAKHVHPDDAVLGCPESETGMCDHLVLRAHDRNIGSPESETGLVSQSYDSDVFDRPSRPRMHVVGHHLIHSNPACFAMGCPDSETGICDLPRDVEKEREDLGAWEF